MAELRDSLNVTVRMPVPVAYDADDSVGLMVSLVVMFWSDTADMRLPEGSCTAPCSMSSWGITMAFTVLVSLMDKSNVMELVPLVVMISFERVTPPVLCVAFRM